MRAEDKEIADDHLVRAAKERDAPFRELVENALPDLGQTEARHASVEHANELLTTMRAIFEGRTVELAMRFPPRELAALEALQAAVTGKTADLDTFMFAEDRRSLLEQSLAELQPHLLEGTDRYFVGANDHMAEIGQRVEALRGQLQGLDDAQEEKIVIAPSATKTETDRDDDDDDDSAHSLFEGPEAVHAPKPSTLSTGGPEATPEPKASTAWSAADVELPAEPERREAPATAAPAEPDKKKPWWRRPFGGS